MTTQVAYHNVTPLSSSTQSLLGEVCPLTHDASQKQRYEHSLKHHYSRYAHPHDFHGLESAYKPPDDSGSDTSQDDIECRPLREHHRQRKSSPRGIVVSAEFRKQSENTIREILARLEQRQHEMNSQRMHTLAYSINQDEMWFHNRGVEVQRVHHSRQRLRNE